MTRRPVLLNAIRMIAEDYDDPDCWEAYHRLDAAEEACERVRRYIIIRRQHAAVPPSWPDLDVLAGFVAAIPGLTDETPEPTDEEVARG